MSMAASLGASGGATTTGPCSMMTPPARSPSSAPQSRSPSHAPQPAPMLTRLGAHAPAKPKSASASSHGDASRRWTTPSPSLLLAKHRILERLREAELHDALGRDLDGLAGLGIAPHARLPVGQDEAPEVRQ